MAPTDKGSSSKWTQVQVKALCGGDLVYDKVRKALMRMFGADHKPNPKDLTKAGREETFYEEHIEDEAFYERRGLRPELG